MKKRIVCALLALIMMVGLVPATALTASAASRSTSEAAITVLKQLEGYSTTCNANGYTGYGTACTEKGSHGAHKTTEKKADAALREALADLDDAINAFASKNGLSLTQSKHDALVLFSFENGTAWTTGTGDFKAAVTSGMKGSEFLNTICRWDASTADDDRRMVEANMYLNGVYSASRPSQFIRVQFNLNGGSEVVAKFDENGDPVPSSTPLTDDDGNVLLDNEGNVIYEPETEIVSENTYMAQSEYQYYDVSLSKAINLTPSNPYHYFLGWYTDDVAGVRVTSLSAGYHGAILYAHWQGIGDEAGELNTVYEIAAKNLASTKVYTAPNGKQTKEKVSGYVWIGSEYLDDNGQRWGGMVEKLSDDEGNTVMGSYIIGWVKLKSATTSTSSSGTSVDVTVTVTNSYVNRRAEASIYSTKNGSYNQGAQLRIIKTASKDGFLWGQVAESADSNTAVGWIALMYTNFESVRNQDSAASNNSNAVATAVITYSDYVNVRSDAGTDNQIVGSLASGMQVDLYETKYVNGIQWGRCAAGWFCLTYANVTRLVKDTSYATDTGYLSYVFSGTINGTIGGYNGKIYATPGDEDSVISTRKAIEGAVTVTNLTNVDGTTWGKISEGWIKVSDSEGNAIDVTLAETTYTVSADALTVREDPTTEAKRVDTLSKGVEFIVNRTAQVVVVGDSVWGYADKIGEDNKTYGGWVNLASKYVTRGNAPTISTESGTPTGKTATIIGADSVRVRGDSSLSGKVIGAISLGTTVNILGERNGWYMIDYEVDDDPTTDSWVYSQYVEVKDGTVESGSTGTSSGETGVGIISNTYGGVNVRSNPGTGSALVGKILPGTQVNILEVTTYGSSKWGRVEQGWICMDYVTIISDLPDDVLAALNGTTSGTTGTTTGSTSTAEVAIYTGTVKQQVNVRKEPSLNAEIVRVLESGANITMHEIVTVSEKVTTSVDDSSTGATITTKEVTSYWARVNDGYIYNPAGHLELDTLDEATYTLTASETLNVRKTPGSQNKSSDDKLFKLAKGDQVAVTRLQIVNGNVWGYIECDDGEGWASLAYMTKGAVSVSDGTTETTPSVEPTTPVVGSTGDTGTGGFVTNTSGYKYTGKVINTNSLNVRATASTTATITTTLKNGASLVIYETVISEYMAWGRCDAGWVYLYYVDMTPVNGAVDARVVYNDNTIAYTDSSCSEVAGTYSKMAVIDIYEIVGKMARTELGWVNTDNLL